MAIDPTTGKEIANGFQPTQEHQAQYSGLTPVSQQAYQDTVSKVASTPSNEGATTSRKYANDVASSKVKPEFSASVTPIGLAGNESATPKITPVKPSPISTPESQTSAEQKKIDEAQTNEQKAIADRNAQLELDKQKADEEQRKRIQAETDLANKSITVENENLARTQADEARRQAEYARQSQEAIDSLKPLIQTEEAQDRLAIENKKASDDLALKSAQIQTEANFQSSLVALNRLGGAFSSATVSTVQNLNNLAFYKLADLKIQSSNQIAELQVQAQKNIVDHQMKLQNIVNENTDKIETSKRFATEAINLANSNILLTEKQKNANVNAIVDKFREEKRNTEAQMYANIQMQNEKAIEIAERHLKDIKDREADKRAQFDIMVSTGGIFTKTNSEIAKIEASAGVPPGTSAMMAKNKIIASVNSYITNSVGVGAGFGLSDLSPKELGDITSEIQNMVRTFSIPIDQATTSVLNRHLEKNQKFIDAKELAMSGSKLAKQISEIQLKQAQKTLTDTKVDTEEERQNKMKAETEMIRLKMSWLPKTEQARIDKWVSDAKASMIRANKAGKSSSSLGSFGKGMAMTRAINWDNEAEANEALARGFKKGDQAVISVDTKGNVKVNSSSAVVTTGGKSYIQNDNGGLEEVIVTSTRDKNGLESKASTITNEIPVTNTSSTSTTTSEGGIDTTVKSSEKTKNGVNVGTSSSTSTKPTPTPPSIDFSTLSK